MGAKIRSPQPDLGSAILTFMGASRLEKNIRFDSSRQSEVRSTNLHRDRRRAQCKI
ncbi:MAG: hypothetical protein HC849_23010 [Oscillatoriales cyanobacterium RU_3_3]|nr:hypothetical protein [Oscillatoriales cyanobacterium RU_3_3]